MKQGRFRLGLIGAGSVVETYHLPVLRGRRDVEIRWVCDRDLRRAESLARTFGVANTYESVEKCPDVDLVLVGIPVGERPSVLDAVTSRGWHALCEKPFAPTLADHRAIVEQARRRGVRLGVGLQRRQYSTTQVARRILDMNLLGTPLQIIAGEGMLVRRTGRGGDWYQGNALASGGALYEVGSHLVDQVFTICGVISYRIERCCQNGWKGLEVETSVNGLVGLESGVEVPFALVVSRVHDVYNGIVVRCRNGQIRIPLSADQPVELSGYNDQAPVAVALPAPAVKNMASAMAEEWNKFLASCRESSGFTDWDTGLLTTAFIEDCFRLAIKPSDFAREVRCG
jgi:predicted dehydrogenase